MCHRTILGGDSSLNSFFCCALKLSQASELHIPFQNRKKNILLLWVMKNGFNPSTVNCFKLQLWVLTLSIYASLKVPKQIHCFKKLIQTFVLWPNLISLKANGIFFRKLFLPTVRKMYKISFKYWILFMGSQIETTNLRILFWRI